MTKKNRHVSYAHSRTRSAHYPPMGSPEHPGVPWDILNVVQTPCYYVEKGSPTGFEPQTTSQRPACCVPHLERLPTLGPDSTPSHSPPAYPRSHLLEDLSSMSWPHLPEDSGWSFLRATGQLMQKDRWCREEQCQRGKKMSWTRCESSAATRQVPLCSAVALPSDMVPSPANHRTHLYGTPVPYGDHF